MDKLSLIQKYEPVLLFSQDDNGREENFFPMSVDSYVLESALYRKGAGQSMSRPALTPETLSTILPADSHDYYLTFAADEILSANPTLRQRLSHGGLVLFSVDGAMTPQLLADDASAVSFATADDGLERMEAEDKLDPSISFSGGEDPAPDVSFVISDMMQLPEQVHTEAIKRYEPYLDFVEHPPVYYFNVTHNRGYLVLQYWFFYAYNDWGSGHDGVNDHEGDWETIAIFLQNDEPAYIAYSAHTGAPEVQPWDNPRVQKQNNTHPVVYVGCGSHASYFTSEGHTIIGYKDAGYGNSQVSIGPGASVAWGDPQDLSLQPWLLNFAGGWGALVKRFGTSRLAQGAQAPTGPVWQYVKWEAPVRWAKVPH